MTTAEKLNITVGVLALQGAFSEHISLLHQAIQALEASGDGGRGTQWSTIEVRNVTELERCDALIIPGGESTAIAFVAERSGLLEPLRNFVKFERKPTWGTCAGLILLAEAANRTKQGGQELIGGLDVRVNRNYYGRQVESFEADLDLQFLQQAQGSAVNDSAAPFRAVFIRAPIVEKILPPKQGAQVEEDARLDTIVAPSRPAKADVVEIASLIHAPVEIMATLPHRISIAEQVAARQEDPELADIIAVKQGNVFGTSFHPELTGDARIHTWWLLHVATSIAKRKPREVG